MLCKLLVHYYVLLNEEVFFKSVGAKVELPELAISLCSLYCDLARESAVAFRKTGRRCQTLHLFQHMCEWQAFELGNPFSWWVYADEDFVGQFIDVAESCHPKTLAITSIWKWLILVFEENA